MSRPRGFADYRPHGKTLALIEAVEAVLDEYADYLPLTLRQIFYRLVVKSVIGKTENEYSRLCEILNRARRARMIHFDAIRDDGVTIAGDNAYQSLDDILASLNNFANTVQLDRQAGQERRLQVWCEAAGMVPQLERVAYPYGVPVMSSGGFDSVTTKHRIGRDLSHEPTTVLHLGDHDPSGVHMFSSLAEDITDFADHYGGDIEFIRLAVTPAHVELYDLPTAPPKPTDRRSFEGLTTQCEALDPATLASVLDSAIVERIDFDAYQMALDDERECRAQLLERLSA